MTKCGRILSITNRQGTPITSDTNIGLLNPFRYRGYVYDDETGLYYLQSRYYDPVTGRFINADVYCDTQSGSPLSTNMYCYCENNCLLSSDPTGYWDKNDHVSITKYNRFWGNSYSVVQNWVYNADSYPCKSTNDYSTPFHGRSNALEIGKKLFNLALKVKSSSKKLEFTFDKKKKGYESISFLKYIKKNGGHDEKKDTVYDCFCADNLY